MCVLESYLSPAVVTEKIDRPLESLLGRLQSSKEKIWVPAKGSYHSLVTAEDSYHSMQPRKHAQPVYFQRPQKGAWPLEEIYLALNGTSSPRPRLEPSVTVVGSAQDRQRSLRKRENERFFGAASRLIGTLDDLASEREEYWRLRAATEGFVASVRAYQDGREVRASVVAVREQELGAALTIAELQLLSEMEVASADHLQRRTAVFDALSALREHRVYLDTDFRRRELASMRAAAIDLEGAVSSFPGIDLVVADLREPVLIRRYH